MPRLSCTVRGRVQGVGFRSWTRRTARALGLAGWVRNLPDGSVEVCAEGEGETLAVFRAALHQGPPFSRVDGVDAVDDAPTAPLPPTFDIRF